MCPDLKRLGPPVQSFLTPLAVAADGAGITERASLQEHRLFPRKHVWSCWNPPYSALRTPKCDEVSQLCPLVLRLCKDINGAMRRLDVYKLQFLRKYTQTLLDLRIHWQPLARHASLVRIHLEMYSLR